MTIRRQAEQAREAALTLQSATTEQKNRALHRMAELLRASMDSLIEANKKDLRAAREKGLSEAFIERLTLNKKRIMGMADDLEKVAALDDPVNEIIEQWTQPSGLHITKSRVPLGVVAIIYESRPNVTVDAAALCIKTGNAAILRGGSDAFESNKALISLMQRAAKEAGLPDGSMSLVMDTSRQTAEELMKLNGLVDVLIPRGGKGLIESVVRTASVPVIQTGDGICHIYVDGECDREMAITIAVSAKVSRPSVCNSAETLLVDSAIAEDFLPVCLNALKEKGVEVRGCARTKAVCPWVIDATDEDWDTEYNDLIYSVKVVDGVQDAVKHINAHGTRHSESIITTSGEHAEIFLALVDAAAVYVNASTRYTDGGEFGFGAEIGISNQKLHARGPMGLKEMTTYKYQIRGNGQIR